MSKKTFVIISILSVMVTYGAGIIDALVNGTFFGGTSGFPFKDTNATLFGQGNVNTGMFVLNVIFWFAIILIIWKLLLKRSKK